MSLTLWTNRLIFFYIWITILSYLPFLNSFIIVSLLVKCSMGRRAKGSCTLWRTFNQLFIMSRSLVAMSATIIVGTIAMDLVNKTLFHLAHLIFMKPYKMKHLMKIWAFMLLFSSWFNITVFREQPFNFKGVGMHFFPHFMSPHFIDILTWQMAKKENWPCSFQENI